VKVENLREKRGIVKGKYGGEAGGESMLHDTSEEHDSNDTTARTLVTALVPALESKSSSKSSVGRRPLSSSSRQTPNAKASNLGLILPCFEYWRKSSAGRAGKVWWCGRVAMVW
jgi:hypothetical protein